VVSQLDQLCRRGSSCADAAERTKLSDGGHTARRLQQRRDAAVRCSDWLAVRGQRLQNADNVVALCVRLDESDVFINL